MKEQIINRLKEYNESYGDLFCGDIWVDIEVNNKEGFGEGLFCQIEVDEDFWDFEITDETPFYVYAYKNYIDEDGDLTSDYSETVVDIFPIYRKDFK